MIGQYLSNINEKATVSILQNILELAIIIIIIIPESTKGKNGA